MGGKQRVLFTFQMEEKLLVIADVADDGSFSLVPGKNFGDIRVRIFGICEQNAPSLVRFVCDSAP